MSRVILILILAILAVAFAIHQQDDRSQQAWKHFKDRYGKRYGVLEEKKTLRIFC